MFAAAMLFHLLTFFLLLTTKFDHQRFPESLVSMNQLQGFLGRFTICEGKTETIRVCQDLSFVRKQRDVPGSVMKAWPLILPVSRR